VAEQLRVVRGREFVARTAHERQSFRNGPPRSKRARREKTCFVQKDVVVMAVAP
jgi:hypothetical protein